MCLDESNVAFSKMRESSLMEVLDSPISDGMFFILNRPENSEDMNRLFIGPIDNGGFLISAKAYGDTFHKTSISVIKRLRELSPESFTE